MDEDAEGVVEQAVDVDLLGAGLREEELGLAEVGRDLAVHAVVGVAVDRALEEVGLDQPILARLEVVGAALQAGRLLAGGGAGAAPDVEHHLAQQLHVPAAGLETAQEFDEAGLEVLAAGVDRPAGALAAAVVGVALAAPAGPVAGQRRAALAAAHEAAQREVGIVEAAAAAGRRRRLAGEHRLGALPGRRLDDRLVHTLDVDPPRRVHHAAGVQGVAEHAAEGLQRDALALEGAQAGLVGTPKRLGGPALAGGDALERLAHQRGAAAVHLHHLVADLGLHPAVAERNVEQPAALAHPLHHAGPRALAAQLVLELVGAGEDRLAEAAERTVVDRLEDAEHGDVEAPEDGAHRVVVLAAAGEAGEVLHHHGVDVALVAAHEGDQLVELRAVRRLRALPLLAEGLDHVVPLPRAPVGAEAGLRGEGVTLDLFAVGDAQVEDGVLHRWSSRENLLEPAKARFRAGLRYEATITRPTA